MALVQHHTMSSTRGKWAPTISPLAENAEGGEVGGEAEEGIKTFFLFPLAKGRGRKGFVVVVV